MEKQQREQVDRNIREAKEKLEAEMEAARHEHQLMLMRQGKVGSCRWVQISFSWGSFIVPTDMYYYSSCELGF